MRCPWWVSSSLLGKRTPVEHLLRFQSPKATSLHISYLGLSREKVWTWRSKNVRRLMIGSTAPTCSYNECRGCRFRCSAEQVPVDANDPINSAYHYRCVCHKRE
ncbi:unnamed protein product [Spirodela intermedia]|uniref:Stomagen C-terminal domain-containing protein n=1 Tax=Spirodela intermedia TaxID=51605 RepID=A0A7I8L5F5_SPIIN|nr:unnamed protein product [Spirodela intermedia]